MENDIAALKQAEADIEDTFLNEPKSGPTDALFTVPGQLDLLDFIQTQLDGNIEPTDAEAPAPQASVIPSRLLQGLSADQLAKRFPVSRSTIDIHRKKGREYFRQWSAEQDPDDIPWEYRQRKYYPALQD